MSAAVDSACRSLRSLLPRGGELPADEWARRHRALTHLLWVVSAALLIASVALGYGLVHTALHIAPLVAVGVIASREGAPRSVRSLATSFGLLTIAALGVHLSGGRIEAHF